MKTIIAIDQGTTGTRAFVMNEELKIVSSAYQEFTQYFPKPGWVEHDPEEIWKTTLKTLKTAISKAASTTSKKKFFSSVAGIGITNQRETVCFWNKTTGKALSKAIVWQDRRTESICADLKRQSKEKFFQERTGLVLDPYFSGSKVSWALQNWSIVKEAHERGDLAVGTIDSFLISRLSGKARVHLTEPSNASRTLCFDIQQRAFSAPLCKALSVPLSVWPQVRPSMGEFCKTQGLEFLPDGIPVTGVLGDQQAALLGQACLEPGDAKCTFGTGAFLLMNTGHSPVFSKNRLLTTIAWEQENGETTYALEGSAFIAGAAVQWLRDGLKLIKKSSEIEKLAKTVQSSEGVVFVPSLTGLGAPHWDANATGMITGITRGTTAGHFARATLEGIAYQNSEILDAMTKDSRHPLRTLKVDGGASKNPLLMQFQADILGVTLLRPKIEEATVLGAVFAAGIGAKIWKNLDEIRTVWKKSAEFKPKINSETRAHLKSKWHAAIKRVMTHP